MQIILGLLVLVGFGILFSSDKNKSVPIVPPPPSPPKPKQPSKPGPASTIVPGYRVATLTPEVVAMAKQILAKNNPMGTQTPFTINNIKYIGRDEIHDHPPQGPHHGVSVYQKIEPVV